MTQNIKNIWFNFYFKYLREKGSFKNDNECFKKIHNFDSENVEEDKTIQRLRRTWTDKRVEDTELLAIQYLLIDTDFYQQFFDLSLTHRIQNYNSEKKALDGFRYLRMIVHKNDKFWGRWLHLFCLRHEFNAKEDIIESLLSLKEYSKKEKKKLNEDDIYNLKEQLFEIIEKSLDKEYFNDTLSNDKLKENQMYKALNTMYKLNFYINYRGWLRNSNLSKDKMSEDETKIIRDKIINLDEKTEKLISSDELEKISSSDLSSDLRMLSLYHYGTKLLGNNPTHFKKIDNEEQEQIVKDGNNILKTKDIEPKKSDTTQYKIWYDFYKFLSIQREMENFLCNKNITDGVEKLKEAKNLLLNLEKKSQNRQTYILLKVKQALITLNYIEQYIKIKELEKDLGQKSNQKSFTELVQWLEEKIQSH